MRTFPTSFVASLTQIKGAVRTSEVIDHQATAEDAMRRAVRQFARIAKASIFILAVAVIAGTSSISAAHADEAQAKSLFKAMSDYLAAQKAISFAYDFNS